jgi:hypothetical protein
MPRKHHPACKKYNTSIALHAVSLVNYILPLFEGTMSFRKGKAPSPITKNEMQK